MFLKGSNLTAAGNHYAYRLALPQEWRECLRSYRQAASCEVVQCAVNFSVLIRGRSEAILHGDLSIGHLEKFFSPSRYESDSLTAMGHGRIERASHGADGLFRC